MALNTKKPARKEPSDEAIDRVMSKAPDYQPVESRAGKGRAKGKGFAMGNKRQITHMITPQLLEQVDEEAERCGEARATVINRAIREHLARVKNAT